MKSRKIFVASTGERNIDFYKIENERQAKELHDLKIKFAFPKAGSDKKPGTANTAVSKNDQKSKENYIEHLAAIVMSSEDAIISKSLDGIIKSWNRGSEKMFGYTAKQAIGKHISLILPPDHLEEEKDIIEGIRSNSIIRHYETVRSKKSGEQFHVSLTLSPVKDRKGSIIGVSKIIRDITIQRKTVTDLINANKELVLQNEDKTERGRKLIITNEERVCQNEAYENKAYTLDNINKELYFLNAENENRAKELAVANKELAFQNEEKEKRADELMQTLGNLKKAEDNIRLLNDELEQKVVERTGQMEAANKELESFSYSVSHDLRAPLRAVHGYAKMLKRSCDAKLDAEESRLMNNILNNAKKMGLLIDELLTFSRLGRKELLKVTIPMQEIVTNICNEIMIEPDNAKIEFKINQLMASEGDITTIKQVWVNLISNAVKYSRFKDKSTIEIGAEIKADEIIYHIKDNGAGFDMQYADKLFEVFQRLHTDQEFEGIGVGLAIVHRIVTKHGGRVWADAKVDEGAVFYFTLKKQ